MKEITIVTTKEMTEALKHQDLVAKVLKEGEPAIVTLLKSVGFKFGKKNKNANLFKPVDGNVI